MQRRTTVSSGTSRLARNTPLSSKTDSGNRSMSSGVSRALAPGATPIMFAPASSTKIKATPEANPSTIRVRDVDPLALIPFEVLSAEEVVADSREKDDVGACPTARPPPGWPPCHRGQ